MGKNREIDYEKEASFWIYIFNSLWFGTLSGITVYYFGIEALMILLISWTVFMILIKNLKNGKKTTKTN